MTWQSVDIIVEAALEEVISELLLEHGALSVTTVAADESEIFEIDGQTGDNWTTVKLTSLFDATMDLGLLTEQLNSKQNVQFTIGMLEDQNWERAWLDNFVPIKISEKLWIIPSWHESVNPQATNVLIDPGMSFGTGTHESTQLCLSWLAELELKNKTLLDYGCGSGILAIAGLKLGAQTAMATDIEPRSLSSTLENAEKNNVADNLQVYMPDELPKQQADIVIANILATTIIELKDVLICHVANGGQLLLAGIVREQEKMIMKAMPEFQWQPRHQGNWIALLGQK